MLEYEVHIQVSAGELLIGDLGFPDRSDGVVVFAHGSGSGRHSPRNRMVARVLQRHGMATLLLDLLTLDEERADAATGHLRFDIELLADRLGAAATWVSTAPPTTTLPIGYFGASTGAGAALVAAARQPELVAAVVSRGGRPDLAGRHLADVRAPTLLVVGGADTVVLDLNRAAQEQLRVETALEVIPGATHLFEEPGALDQVAEVAAGWFTRHLRPAAATARRR
jgi:putative phosphoribosyl transferase